MIKNKTVNNLSQSLVCPQFNDPGHAPLVSIVTVVRNAADDLRATIESVVAHRGENGEYVVIDGGSHDGTVAVLRHYGAAVDFWCSEPDDGIYDAMNKAIALCSGRYILFLNAGDELVVQLDSLREVLACNHVLVYGKAHMINAAGELVYVKGKELKSLNKLVRGTPLCHQAIFYRRDCMGSYDTSYRIMADRVLTYTLIKHHGLGQACFVDSVIANYYEGGFSRQHEDEWRREECRFLYSLGKRWYARYRMLGLCFERCLSVVKRFLAGRRNHGAPRN